MADRKFQKVNGIRYNYSTEWIHDLESEEHWRLYWHQQHLMRKYLLAGDSILEIGPGTGFTSNYLRAEGFKVTTIDIDEGKNADITANVVSYDFTESYDFICAFEVLEHIPFAEAVKLIQKTSGQCRKGFFISLPGVSGYCYALMLKFLCWAGSILNSLYPENAFWNPITFGKLERQAFL